MLAEKLKADVKVRKLITCYRMHHPRADTEHSNVKRENGERGFILLELTNKITTIGLKKYLDTTTDWFGLVWFLCLMAYQPL